MTRTLQMELEGEIDFTRQRDWFNPQDHPDASVTLIGCGGIGSPTAICLSKLGIPNLTLIDFDEVEPHNVPNQFYAMEHVGVSKVEALAQMCNAFGSAEVTVLEGKGEDYPNAFSGIVVTGLDSMFARKQMWEQVKDNPKVELLVDARLGGQLINIVAFNPNDKDMQEYYEAEMLFDDSEAIPAPCTARGVIDVSFQVASLITRQVRRYLTDQEVESFITINQATLEIDKSQGWLRSKVLEALDQVKV